MNHDAFSKILSQNLKAIRQANGLTTTDLGKILGVSQAKISYMEHGKGVLSARDIAVLARKLGLPITDFFRGIESQEEQPSELNLLAGHLAYYGATLLAKPPGIILRPVPFEDVICRALSFIEDDRLQKAFCAALITRASSHEINFSRIFALIGANTYQVSRILVEAQVCIQIISVIPSTSTWNGSRAKRQIQQLASIAAGIAGEKKAARKLPATEVKPMADFVEGCLSAKR